MRCRAVLYCVVLCHVVQCCVLCRTYSFVHARYHSKYHTSDRYTRFVRTTLLKNKKCTPSSAQLSSAAQRSAVPCLAVLCRAAACCALLRCAFFRTYSTRYHAKYQVSGTGMYVLVFSFSSLAVLSRSSSCPSSPPPPWCKQCLPGW